MHILIVDDEENVRRALDRLLRSQGHTTCWSATGAGGLKLMRTEPVDVVLLDMMLGPGEMSGWEVAREKLLDGTIRHIPVIVLSGLATVDIHAGAKAGVDALSGATLLLSKPCDADVLFKAIDLICEGRTKPQP